MVRNCWWCHQLLPLASAEIRTHGDNLVRCDECGAIYMAILLLTIPRNIWTAIDNRNGVTVERDGDVLVVSEV